LFELARQGVPLWWQPLADGQCEVTLCTGCRTRGELDGSSVHPYSRGVPTQARQRSVLLPSHPLVTRASFWEIAETATVGLAFVGTSSRDAWPHDGDAARRGLPSAEHLGEIVRSRRTQRGVADPGDYALRLLADQPLYGFWIQILLAEAL